MKTKSPLTLGFLLLTSLALTGFYAFSSSLDRIATSRKSPDKQCNLQEPENLPNPQVGKDITEHAVMQALDWFSKNQEPDGLWSIQKHGGQRGHDNAATAFALLSYLGWGAKHTEPGKYQQNVKDALKWLVEQQAKDGGFTNQKHNGMYDQGVVTLALAEAYGATKDKQLKEPLKLAVSFIIEAQNQNHGAWDYRPKSPRIDSSISAWQLAALYSARTAGLEIPDRPFELAEKWLDAVGAGRHRGIYGYDKRQYKTPAMVAAGLYSQQILGVSPDHPRMQESVKHLSQHMPTIRNRDFYYWYYATLSLFQHQGPTWSEWNQEMKPIWSNLQETDGPNAGSWAPRGGNHMGDMGRVITTALATLSLEVYYRHLLIFQPKPIQ